MRCFRCCSLRLRCSREAGWLHTNASTLPARTTGEAHKEGRHRRQVRDALRRLPAQADQEDGGQPALQVRLQLLRQGEEGAGAGGGVCADIARAWLACVVCVVCGVWCVVCGVWCVVCGVWCVVCGVWCVVCGVWCVVCCWRCWQQPRITLTHPHPPKANQRPHHPPRCRSCL